jgi:hypothetical protein
MFRRATGYSHPVCEGSVTRFQPKDRSVISDLHKKSGVDAEWISLPVRYDSYRAIGTGLPWICINDPETARGRRQPFE